MLSLATIRLVLGLAALLGAAMFAAIAMHKVDNARYEALVASQAQGAQKALEAAIAKQAAYDAASIAAAEAEAQKQAALAAAANARKQEVRVHVITKRIAATCVPWGLIRVFDAAAIGSLASDLPLPAGKSDDACAPVTWLALANAIVANYDAANANAEQLNALIVFIKQMAAKR